MSNDLNKEKLAKEALRDYMKIVEQEEADELMRFMDDNYRPMEKKAACTRRDVVTDMETKTGVGMPRILRYAAVLLIAIITISIVVPVQEVSAWVVWKFDAIFGEEDNHTVIDPVDEKDYIKYYQSEIPAGFKIKNSMSNDNQTLIEYVNDEGNYILFTQVKTEQFKAHIDNENRQNRYEIINDFETLISEGQSDYYFEIIADSVVITVQTDATYEVGKGFINTLKKL